MLNYEIALLVGILPATACIIVILLALVIIPLMIYQWHNRRLARTSHARATTELFKHLIEDSYNPEKMGSTAECSICLDTFIPGSTQVTILPCNAQHSFHSKCIKTWLAEKHLCPLDK